MIVLVNKLLQTIPQVASDPLVLVIIFLSHQMSSSRKRILPSWASSFSECDGFALHSTWPNWGIHCREIWGLPSVIMIMLMKNANICIRMCRHWLNVGSACCSTKAAVIKSQCELNSILCSIPIVWASNITSLHINNIQMNFSCTTVTKSLLVVMWF